MNLSVTRAGLVRRGGGFGTLTAAFLGLGAVLVFTAPLWAQSKDKKAPDPAQVAADAERAKLIAAVPASTADYTFGADKAQLGWEGMQGTGTVKDYFGPGADALDTQRIDYSGKLVYWPLTGIKAGKYYIGLWTQSNDPNYRTEYSPGRFLATIYLNGSPVRFATTSDPVQVKPNLWLAELQTAGAIELKETDEIALSGSWDGKYLRLSLYANPPTGGHGVTGQTWGLREGMPPEVRLVVKVQFVGSQLDGDEHEARVTIANPLPVPAQIDADVLLADYFGKPLVKETTPLTIAPHKTAVISHKFKAVGTDVAYQLDVKTYHNEVGLPWQRPPVEMVPMNDFLRLGFLPGRPGPLDVWQHTRMELVRNQTGQRMMMCLDGDNWQIAPLTTRRMPKTVPDKLDFKPTGVPYRNRAELPEGVYGQWFRKTLKLPQWMSGQRYILDITQIVVEGTVFVNGVQVGSKREGSALPLVVDITDQLKPGADNELVICAAAPSQWSPRTTSTSVNPRTGSTWTTTPTGSTTRGRSLTWNRSSSAPRPRSTSARRWPCPRSIRASSRCSPAWRTRPRKPGMCCCMSAWSSSARASRRSSRTSRSTSIRAR